MSIKNQTKLTIYALIILGVTVLSITVLNYLIAQIAKIPSKSIAMNKPENIEKPSQDDVYDAEVEKNEQAKNLEEPRAKIKPTIQEKPEKIKYPNEMPRSLKKKDEALDDSLKKGNKNSPNLRQPPFSPPRDQRYPPQYPPGFSEKDKRLFEEEIERQREMMRNFPEDQYPEDYYPDPNSEDYDYPYEDYEEDMPYQNGYDNQNHGLLNTPTNTKSLAEAKEDSLEKFEEDEYYDME